MKRDSMNREEAIKIKKEYDSRIKKSIQRMGVKDVFYADYNALRSNKTLIEDLLEFLNLSCSDQGNIYEKVLSPDELKVEKRKEAKRKLMIAIKKAVLSPSKFFRWRSYNELHRLIGYWWNG
jgi:serine protease inhibitor